MKGQVESHGYLGFMIIDREKRILVSSYDELIGTEIAAGYLPFFNAALGGSAGVTRPFPSTIPLPDGHGGFRPGVPTMIAGAPIRNAAGEIVALLGLRIRPEVDFTRILAVARTGSSGETYACDAQGVMLSESRFDDELKQIGLLPDREDANSIFNVQVRNPGVDMTAGGRPELRRSEQPLTFAAAELAAGHSGSNVVGYRDYRGVMSVGAWKWLPDFGFGIITEMDLAQATAPFTAVRRTFWGLFALLLVASIVIFVYSILMARLQRSARRAALEAKRLGQYVLEERLGSGGMGAVYRAHHDMLPPPDGGQTDRSGQDHRRGHRAVRARGATDQPVEPSEHHRHLRFWPHAGRVVLLCHGTARRPDAANARRALRPAARSAAWSTS